MLSSGDDNKTNPLVSYWNHALDTAFWNIEFSIATTETGTYNVSIVDRTTGTTLSENVGLTGNNTILFDITASPATPLISYNLDLVVSTTDSANFSTFTPTVEFERTEFDGDEIEIVTTGNYQTSPALQSIIGTIEISMQIPKMRVIDFLTSIFKQFNLTAYVEDGVIIVKTLDSYYADGGEHDITPYVDVTDSQVGRAMLYKNIEFKYPDPKTFLTIQKNERDNIEFGNLEYTGGDNFDGGNYDINIDFEHALYERLNNENTGALTPLLYGWLADKDQNPTSTAPLVFYNINESSASVDMGFMGFLGSVAAYNRPSNVLSSGDNTINFNAEIDEFSLSTNENSLFDEFYTNYIANLFNIKTRLFTVKAFLPLKILLSFKLNDRFIVSGKRFKINSITTNLQTRESSIELINDPVEEGEGTITDPTELKASLSETDIITAILTKTTTSSMTANLTESDSVFALLSKTSAASGFWDSVDTNDIQNNNSGNVGIGRDPRTKLEIDLSTDNNLQFTDRSGETLIQSINDAETSSTPLIINAETILLEAEEIDAILLETTKITNHLLTEIKKSDATEIDLLVLRNTSGTADQRTTIVFENTTGSGQTTAKITSHLYAGASGGGGDLELRASSGAGNDPTTVLNIMKNGSTKFIPLSADPSNPEEGQVYFNSTSNKLRCYDGTTWNNLF